GSRLRRARRRGRSRPPGASGLCAGLRLRDALARRVHDPPPLGHRADELHALAEEPLRLLPAGRHLLDRLPDVTRREVVAPVEGPVDQDAELVAVPGEAAGALDAHTLADVLQDLLVPRLVADDEEAEPAILQDLQGLAVDVGARVGRPGDAHPAEALRDLARA